MVNDEGHAVVELVPSCAQWRRPVGTYTTGSRGFSVRWFPGTITVPVLIEGSVADGFTATTPVLKGCIAEGDTLDDAIEDFTRALKAVLETYKSRSMDVPWEKPSTLPTDPSRIRVVTVSLDG